MDVFQLLIKLIEHFGLIVAGCFILMRFSGFRKIILKRANTTEKFFIALFFGGFGIIGTYMGVPVLGGKVIAKAGGTVVLTAGGEIFTNLERGVIDATEWVGPLHDLRMGFYQAAKYYYYPGWHEPGTYLEYFFNKKAYESLPKDLQQIIDAACMESEQWTLAQFEARNGAALQELITKHKVQLIRFPDEVLAALRPLAEEVREEEAAKDPLAKKVNEDFKKFQKVIGTWGSISEDAYYDIIARKYSLKG